MSGSREDNLDRYFIAGSKRQRRPHSTKLFQGGFVAPIKIGHKFSFYKTENPLWPMTVL